MTRVNPGRMRERITLERRTETVTASGAVAVVWTPEATLRAELVQQDAQAFLAGERTEGRAVFRLWAVEWITTDFRLIHNGRSYAVAKIVPLDRMGVELHCVDSDEVTA